jgi:hypothetical protein
MALSGRSFACYAMIWIQRSSGSRRSAIRQVGFPCRSLFDGKLVVSKIGKSDRLTKRITVWRALEFQIRRLIQAKVVEEQSPNFVPPVRFFVAGRPVGLLPPRPR